MPVVDDAFFKIMTIFIFHTVMITPSEPVNMKRRRGTGFNKHNKFVLNNKQGMLAVKRMDLIQTINYK